MIINHHKQYIFVHIPRTSGTNMYDCLSGDKNDDNHLGHSFARKIRSIYPKEFEKYHTFSVVRNPFERLHSWWFNRRYLKSSGTSKTNSDFKTWLLNDSHICINWSVPNWTKTMPQTRQFDWLSDENENIIVDTIIRYETLQDDLQKLGEIIKEDFSSMPRYGINNPKNKKRTDYKSAYDKKMIDFVNDKHRKDLDFFNYKFD